MHPVSDKLQVTLKSSKYDKSTHRPKGPGTHGGALSDNAGGTVTCEGQLACASSFHPRTSFWKSVVGAEKEDLTGMGEKGDLNDIGAAASSS